MDKVTTTRFRPGESGNPSGRPKGAKNKIVPFTKQEIGDFLTDQWSTIQRDFKKLEPPARIQYFLKLLSFVMPPPKQTDLNLDFGRFTDEQLDAVIQRIVGGGRVDQ